MKTLIHSLSIVKAYPVTMQRNGTLVCASGPRGAFVVVDVVDAALVDITIGFDIDDDDVVLVSNVL